MMNRQSISSLNGFATLILILLAAGTLLIPNHLAELTLTVPFNSLLALGLGWYVVGYVRVATTVIPVKREADRLFHLLTTLSLGTVLYLYARAHLVIELIIPAALALGHLLSIFDRESGNANGPNIVTRTSLICNLAAGLILSLGGRLLDSELYQAVWQLRIILISLFFVTAGLGGFALLFPNRPASALLVKLMSLPWLAWSLINLPDLDLARILPGLCLAGALLFADYVPWRQLILPPHDILGRRVIWFAGMSQGLLLAFLVGLLTWAERTYPPQAGLAQTSLTLGREIAFVFFAGTSLLLTYVVTIIIVTINGLFTKFAQPPPISTPAQDAEVAQPPVWKERLAFYLKPFALLHERLLAQMEAQSEHITSLSQQLETERHRYAQQNLLAELSQQLRAQLDQPVAAQLAVNTLQRALHCSLAALFVHEPERREFVALATAGSMTSLIPPGYRQGIGRGLIGQAASLRKTVSGSEQPEAEPASADGISLSSSVAVPLIHHGHVKGVIQIWDERANAFSSSDILTAEAVATELLRAWEHSGYHQRLTILNRAGISLSTLLDPQAAVREIAIIARQALEARFTFVTLLDQGGSFTRYAYAGYAPRLLKTLHENPFEDTLMRAALNASQPFRIRDVRRYKQASHIEVDHNGLRSLLAIPIRLRGLSIGAILVFGKQGEVFFTENDESLASLLASQASAAIESSWLYQQLGDALKTTTRLYQLSVNVIQARELSEAALHIAETAHKVANAATAGIVLFTPEDKIEAEVEYDAGGAHTGSKHPMELIRQAMQTGQSIFVSADEVSATICFPLQTPRRKYGALWLNIPEGRAYQSRYAPNLQTLTNQAAVALERAILLAELQQHAREIESAYRELEVTYDRTLAALMSALDFRDRETEGHSLRVGQLACRLGEELGLTLTQLKAIERGALLHDIGKIGISDTILHKPGPLGPDEWKIMRMHPDIGARIVEDIPFLQDALQVVRYHQERWDGSGYPIGLRGNDIPLLARIFAVADAFDALISDRPYRQRITPEEALAYLREQSGVLFDPEIIETFLQMAAEGQIGDLIKAP